MKRVSFLLLLVVAIACSPSGAQSTEILSPVDFEKKLNEVKDKQVIDVRTASEFTQGHVAGAIVIDYFQNDFKAKVSKLDRNKPVFVYCAAGKRSGSATEVFEELGFKKIYDLRGGMNAWAGAGKPVVK